ncbi:MAG TPA: M20 family metallo-hydrolase [Myxococcota bacterium]|nr:M20 family metallo-hydrolase [Myxococcota bacterium]
MTSGAPRAAALQSALDLWKGPAQMGLVEHLRPERLLADLARYRRIGQSGPDGAIDRPALGPADTEARGLLVEDLRAAGATVTIDAVGNVYGRLGASDRPATAAGSHLDTVPRAGAYDGPVGVLAALEVLRALRAAGTRTRHPVELACFTGEEGSRFPLGTLGSAAASGRLLLADALALRDGAGVTMREAVAAAYGDPDRLARPGPARFESYVELHVEQGGVLERAGDQIGVVERICGLHQLTVTFGGDANHAGTTPMGLRLDALAGAADFILATERRARADAAGAVATVGWVHTEPGGFNQIPGTARLGVDVRAPDPAALEALVADLRAAAAATAAARGLRVETADRQHVDPAALDPAYVAVVEQTARALGLRTRRMNSGAVHDALKLAPVVPAAMVFVPSVGGKSHTPEEHTRDEDLVAGLRVLAEVIAHRAGVTA